MSPFRHHSAIFLNIFMSKDPLVSDLRAGRVAPPCIVALLFLPYTLPLIVISRASNMYP